jgi:hypothetical protein
MTDMILGIASLIDLSSHISSPIPTTAEKKGIIKIFSKKYRYEKLNNHLPIQIEKPLINTKNIFLYWSAPILLKENLENK